MQPGTTGTQVAAGAGRTPLPPVAPSPESANLPPFEDAKFRALCKTSRLWDWLFRYPLRPMRAVRWLARFFHGSPVFRLWFTRWVVVLGYNEVREVLSHDAQFSVPWGKKMKDLTANENFVLGMPFDDKYRLSYRQLAEAFPREEVPGKVAVPAAEATLRILARQPRELDAVQDLITAVPTELCDTYYGIRIADKTAFAKWTLAVSTYTFGPRDTEERTALAMGGAARLSRVIRASIATARKDPNQGTVLPRFIQMQGGDASITDDVIHAQLFGMVLGWIPTNVLAGGNILETLLRFPDFLERARAAAQSDDDDLLWRCLREALRFRHINPGPWRECLNGYTFGAGGPGQVEVAPGSKVLALIQSAMFDPLGVARAHVFDPDRRDEDYMVFGFGQHWCLGAYIAIAQLTQTFKPLLRMRKLEAVQHPDVRTTRFNDLFPVSLMVRYEP